MIRILLVEDEEHLRTTLRLNLEWEGYEVVASAQGNEALKLVKEQHFDLAVLDVMLPEIDGFQVCERIRLDNYDLPIIFLTAKESAEDRITGLRKGADDYLVKPFELEELLLRLQNLLKRKAPTGRSNTQWLEFGCNKINFLTFEAETAGGKIILTKKEAMLLKLFADRKNEVVSRKQILQTVWGYEVFPSTRTIDNFILMLRKYFEEDAKNPRFFHSVRGVGYRFIPEGQ